MANSRDPEFRLSVLITVSRWLCVAIGLLFLAWATEIFSAGRTLDAIFLFTIGIFSSLCLFTALSALTVLVDLAQVARYRAERDQEIDLMLTEVRVLLREYSPPAAASASSPSAAFRSSVMPFDPKDDAALTAHRPVIKG